MTKFELGQEVFYILETQVKRKSKCLDCNGEGSVPSKVKDKNIVCSSCQGRKNFYKEPKRSYVPQKETIVGVSIFDVGDIIIEEYIISNNLNIFSSNVETTCLRLDLACHLYNSGYDGIDVDEEFIEPIYNLYGSKDEAIEECRKLKQSNKKDG